MFVEFVAAAVHGLVAVERVLRPPIKKVVQDYDSLLHDPDEYFSLHPEARIGPYRPWAIPAAVGPLGGLFAIAGLLGVLRGDNVPLEVFIGSVAFAVGFGLAFGGTWYVLRGGTVVLTRDAVLFLYRSSAIACPWELFSTREGPRPGKNDRIDVRIDPAELQRVSVVYRNSDLEWTALTGPPMRCRSKRDPAYYLPEQVSLYDIYRCRLHEVVLLIVTVARRLTPP